MRQFFSLLNKSSTLRLKCLLLTLASYPLFFLHAQQKNADSHLIGVWKGSSICQIKNSPCHDETIVYHISKAEKTNQYSLSMKKIVDDKEENMGTLIFDYDPSLNELNADLRTDGHWKFKLSGQKLHGTLYLKGALYRIIEASKSIQ